MYEGFPLYLRRTTDVDTPAHRRRFSHLAAITHTFAKRLPDGLPEFDYNETLAEFDHDAVTAFDAARSGVPVLVETFGGERTYYFYVAPETDVSATVARFATSHPAEQITCNVRPDPDWAFLERYAADLL
jgi:hypothetical protein